MHPLLNLASSIRFGFATNSSSSHSVLLIDPKMKENLKAMGWAAGDRGEYGWSWFALAESEEKLDYIWTDMYGQINGLMRPKQYISAYSIEGIDYKALPEYDTSPKGFSAALTSQILEHSPKPFGEVSYDADGTATTDPSKIGEPYIDHDSCFSFPLDQVTNLPHVGFARWTRDIFLNPNVVVFGGNDNDEDGPSHPAGDEINPLRDDEYGSPLICLERQSHWLLFQKETGTKIRIPKVNGQPVLFTEIPELVDVKLTNKCGMGCAFCYQDSTPDGAHPKMALHEMITVIKKLGVLEIAVGGGEPLEYPDFWSFVGNLQGTCTVNITTRRLDLIPFWDLDRLGGIGYSVESAALLKKALIRVGLGTSRKEDYRNPWRKKLVVHVVLGALPVSEILAICKVAKQFQVPVLFLAYKTDGRGASVPQHPHEDWVDQIKDAFWNSKYNYWEGPVLGVDTPTAERWGADLKEKLNVDSRLMSMGEGQFSLYIDFVEKTFAKASYGDVEKIPFATVNPNRSWQVGDTIAEDILAYFRSWHEEAK